MANLVNKVACLTEALNLAVRLADWQIINREISYRAL